MLNHGVQVSIGNCYHARIREKQRWTLEQCHTKNLPLDDQPVGAGGAPVSELCDSLPSLRLSNLLVPPDSSLTQTVLNVNSPPSSWMSEAYHPPLLLTETLSMQSLTLLFKFNAQCLLHFITCLLAASYSLINAHSFSNLFMVVVHSVWDSDTSHVFPPFTPVTLYGLLLLQSSQNLGFLRAS